MSKETEKESDEMPYPVNKHLNMLLILILWPLVCVCSQAAAESITESPDAHMAAYEADLAAFKRLRGNLSRLTADIKKRPDLFGPRPEEDLRLLQPEKRYQIQALWYPVLDNYLAMDRLAEKHMGFYQLQDKMERQRSFHLARGLFLTQYRMALDLIAQLEQNPLVDTILNEGDETLGLPRGGYAHFKYQYLNVIKAGNYAAVEAVALGYGVSSDTQLAQWAKADSRIILEAGKGPGALMTFKNGLLIVQRTGYKAWFPVQKGVAEWMGHTKVYRPYTYLISPEQVKALSTEILPGDILLERREWYMTNVGIPGFWTHAALYIGSSAQRRAFSKLPEVKEWLEQQQAENIDDLIEKRYPAAYADLQKPYNDGRLPRVIEAIASGVTLTSLSHSAGCDSLAVLRPRMSAADRAAAVVRAMRYYAKPYDYSFDFASDTSLVCTELVVKAYLPGDGKQGLALPVENLMGRMLTPANTFARQFDRTFGRPEQQLDLVAFLDGIEKEKLAVESDIKTFRQSWQRPKWHILIQDEQSDMD